MLYITLIALLLTADASRTRASQPLEPAVIDDCRYDTSMAVAKELDELISEADPMLGNPESDVVLVEFFDPNCTHCRSLHPIMEEVVEAYGDRIRYYKKPFALSRHSLTQIGAMLIAAEEDKFYEMAAFQLASPHAPYLSHDELVRIAEEIGLDGAGFEDALLAGAYLDRVQFLRNQAREAGVRGTPTLLVNSPRQVLAADSRSLECISGLLDSELGG